MTSLATHIFRCDGHVLTVILAACSAALSRLYDACHIANQPCPKFSRRFSIPAWLQYGSNGAIQAWNQAVWYQDRTEKIALNFHYTA